MATASARTLWKGAISFGLVHIPVSLHAATQDLRPKMRMLEAGSGAQVGYQKIDKRTGEAIAPSDLVKGMEVAEGQFVTLTKEEIREALPRSTQTIEIEAFVPLQDVPPVFYNKPYYTSPIHRGSKVYALLRDVLRRTGRAGLGRIVVSTRQHLALVVASGDGLVVNLLRWADEVRSMAELPLPGAASDEGVTERELGMGEQLVLELSDDWHPERYRDEFREKLEALVEAKRRAGDITHAPAGATEAPVPTGAGAEVIDLTELLRKSLRQAPAAAPAAAAPAPRRPAARAPAPAASTRSRSAARKAANDDEAAAAQRAAAAAKPSSTARTTAKAPRRKVD
ncbi:Ku protein [Ramlibacter sp. AN1015]|uniref:non-homologous end joining protein Ku n=1 Tax=Ramlibacter sp. AN1015 TaxID=3133428 RepID=UPI0030C1C394